ncbi:general transcription factor 3C polypeptide 1-like [Branchiostoma lanceolatum]|uniref:general transcription factor 3C polypeptide 1-like n=1 Tax=Branchiostoma lanceolatum TaxID=7740 RepID=UPI00345469E6
MDVLEDCLDEVALEGLDGITISALWLRLEKRKPSFRMSLDEFTKPFIWECLVTSPDIQFYELPEPRPPLVINDNIVKDEETGYDIRTEDLGTSNIYPIAMVTDSKVGERGSCATYKERRNITGEVRTEDGGLQCTLAEAVERWNSKLVLVASQSLRQQALFHEDVLPDAELTDIQYCILERVGRARHLGELQADMKVMLDANSKYLFHVRKGLVKYDLITRQSTMYTVPGNSRLKNSVLLLLKRFHTTHKSKNMVLMDALLNILQTKPDQMAVINDLKEEMDLSSNTFKKVYQALEVQGKIKGILLPTKEIYPDPNDPKILNNKRIRKVIRCLKLIKTVDEDEEADEDDIDDPEQTPYPVVYERPFLNQAYDFMYSRGPLGITQHDLRLAMRMGRYEARGLCRSMAYSGIAVEIMEDRGKVRTTRYVAKSLLDQNQLKQQFEVEQLKNNRLRKRDNKQGDKTGATASTTPATTADVNVPSPIPSTSTDKTTENTEEGKPADMDASQDATPKRSTLLTYRRLRRTNIILEVLKSTKVVDKAFRFVKAIRASEEKEGFCGLLDKKSVLRLLQEMISEGQVKVIKTIIVQDGIEKPVTFYVEPNISPADGMVKSAIEQIKFKMVRGRDPEKKERETQPKHTIDLEADLQKMEEDIPYKPIKKTVGVYNFQPKFARLKLVHQFLWYLVYEHRDPGPSDSSVEITQSQDKTTTTTTTTTTSEQAETPVTGDAVTKEAVVTTVSQLDSTEDQENVAPKDSSEGPSKDDNQLNQADASFGMNPTPNRVYVNEQSWKRFVPPIPVHGNYGPGWFLVSDVLCVIPLNLFCQFIRVLCEVDDIEDYLSDPEKRHTLVRHLPTRMRHQLLYKRKYLYSFHELMERLSAMGLAKIGPRGHKEKDQIFIYLNKNATIVDTTTSSPGYFIVKDDKDFIIRRFQFTSEKDVEAYWCAMEYICLNTPLGSARLKESSAPKGHVGLETWRSRARLLQFATPEDDIVDDGSIPGDGKGAGGLDSVFFSHLKRNWKLPPLSQGREYPSQLASGSSMSALASSTGDGSLTKPKRLPKQVYFIKMPFKSPQRKSQSSSADEHSPRKGKQQLIKVTKVQDFTKDRNKKVKGGKGQKRKREKKLEAPKPPKVRKRKASFSDGPPRKKEKTYQRFHDNRDKAALSRMKRQRVSWTPQEDSLILRCRVASALLNKKVQQSFVPWVVVRDLLHDTFQASEDKTTLSVARRSTYIMKNSQTALNFKIGLAEVHQDKEFMSWISSMNGDYTDPGVCAEEYRIVVGKLQEKFRDMPGALDDELPDTMEELLSKYQIMTVGHPHHHPQKTITSIDDIHLQVLRNFIWNCLGATEADKTKFAFLAYKLFNKYPSGVLERAFLSMKKQGLVNQSKGNIPKSKVRAVPMAAIGYKLSAIAERHFQPGMPTSVFPQAQELLTRLNEDRALGVEGQGVEFPSEGSGGHTACVFSLMATNQLSYTVDIPENIVVVDSSVENPVEAAKKVTRKDGSDSEVDTENSTGASKPSTAPGFPNANQASRTKVLAARSGGAAPGVLSLRNLEPTDNIVINSCTVNLRLPRKLFDHEERLSNNDDPQQSSNSSKFLLVDPSESGRDPADNAIPWAEFVSICREEFQYSDPDVQRVKDIYDYIEVGEGLGVKLKDLQSMFRNAVQEDSKFCTDDHIRMLIRFGMCLEVGIHEPRLVTAEHCGPWFMHSSRLVSMATSAQTDMTSQPGTSKDNADTVLHVTHTPQSTSTTSHIEEPAQGTSEMLGKEDGQTKTDQLLSEDSTDKTLPDSEEADTTKDADVLPSKTGGREGSREEMKLRPRLPKTPTPGRRKENPETDLQVQMQASKYGVYEPVDFLSRPWHAVDGSVNRQVLQNMLQGVLLRILQKPGISQTAVLQHINTVLPAMAALQLLQMLQSVGCITSRHIRRAPKATLFSAPVSLIEGKGDNDEIYYEPTADAILKLNELFHHT